MLVAKSTKYKQNKEKSFIFLLSVEYICLYLKEFVEKVSIENIEARTESRDEIRPKNAFIRQM